MKKSFLLLCTMFLMFSTNAWALPIVGNTPEPATMFLLGIGLVGIAGIQRRKKQQ